MKQLTYLIAVLCTALMLACTSAFGQDNVRESVQLDFAAIRALRYWGQEPKLPNFPIRMVDYVPGHPTYVGACRYTEQGPIELLIVRGFWYTASNIEKTWIMVHEIGHCVLGLGHSSDPNNIMSHQPPNVRMQAIILENMLKPQSKLKGAP